MAEPRESSATEDRRRYAIEQAAALLNRFAYHLGRVAQMAEPAAVHELRVATRRFQRCLRVFKSVYPDGSVGKVIRRLRELRLLGADVRNRDIAIDLAIQAGLARDSKAILALTEDRRQARRKLVRIARRWARRDVSRKWRARLGL